MGHIKIKGNLPDIHERMLLALYTLHIKHALEYCMFHNAAGYQGKVYFTGRGVASILGGDWSSYRHKQMVALSKNGWVVISVSTGRNKWSYAMTETGIIAMNDRFHHAMKDVLDVSQEVGF